MSQFSGIIDSIQDRSPVAGSTHSFYRYPARFSPRFAQAAISSLTKPGDVVYDPFVGGGTTLVESMRLGRKSLGTDLNSLAIFISKVKTTLYDDDDLLAVWQWADDAQSILKLNRAFDRPMDWISQGYQRNISSRRTWPIRKILEIAICQLQTLRNEKQRDFIRCLLLKTAQWAIDCRRIHPSAHVFRRKLLANVEEMIEGTLSLRNQMPIGCEMGKSIQPVCLHTSAQEIAQEFIYPFSSSPTLILTSPPYPGVHVLYHRWQVNGRRETPAPYWIANCLDGNGASFYAFGDRKQPNLKDYFDNMRKCYKAFSEVANRGTWLVQLVAFSQPEWQLPTFLEILQECNFFEVLLEGHSSINDGRSWRNVPNRKFYADRKGRTPSSKEVLLVHRRA